MALVLLITLLGCNLTRGAQSTATPEVIFVSPTPEPITDIQNFNSGPPTPLNNTCAVRTDWPIYVVAAGDTLGVIAARTESTIEELVIANCLDNPDAIFSGQELHVPIFPPEG
jgi:LysM repeat protein